jgi:Bacterial regulatory protein, arsR family
LNGIFFSRIAEKTNMSTNCYARIAEYVPKLVVLNVSGKEVVVDARLVRALLNPTRIRILDSVAEGPATPRQLAASLGQSVDVVSYHLEVLRATGCIQRGEPSVGDDPFELAPSATPIRRLAHKQPPHAPPNHPSAAVLREILSRGIANLKTGSFGERRGEQLSCISVVLDRQGWYEVTTAIGDALDRVSIAYEKSTARLADNEEAGIDATVAMASFGSRRAA